MLGFHKQSSFHIPFLAPAVYRLNSSLSGEHYLGIFGWDSQGPSVRFFFGSIYQTACGITSHTAALEVVVGIKLFPCKQLLLCDSWLLDKIGKYVTVLQAGPACHVVDKLDVGGVRVVLEGQTDDFQFLCPSSSDLRNQLFLFHFSLFERQWLSKLWTVPTPNQDWGYQACMGLMLAV